MSSTWHFGRLSEARLIGVHPDLDRVARLALSRSPVDFAVIEGRRTRTRQEQLVKAGASWTMDSRHITGHAIDLAPIVGGRIRWDWPLFDKLAPAVKEAAAELGVAIVWGGDWKVRDGPHFELNRKAYP